jgi:uncharacterized membrane protein (UPF0182 family)
VPLLQKVLLSYGDGGTYVVLANSLREGLDALVAQGKTAGTTPPAINPTNPPNADNDATPPPTLPGQLADAAAALDKAIADVKAAQASGDFVRYGQALQALDTAMNNFQAAQRAAGATTGPTAGPSASTPANPSPTTGG